jgi:hypothetical protein
MSFNFALVGVLAAAGLVAPRAGADDMPGLRNADLAPPAAAVLAPFAAQVPPVRIWVDEGLDLFYPGDRVELRFRTSEDAYVAVLHVDTDGVVDLLYPSSRWDDEFVYGRRTYAVPLSGRSGPLVVSRNPGIGYFYIIASHVPLDLGMLYGGRGLQPLDGWGPGRALRGDPFWALDRITRHLVRDARLGSYATDVYSYHVGGRHRYPSYACYDRYSRFDSGVGYPWYASCDDLQRLLGHHPYYYDTRRFRGDREVYRRDLDRLAPQHGFKERPDAPVRWAEPRAAPSESRGRGITPVAPARTDRAEPPREPVREEPARAVPARQRPTLERRAEPREERDPAPARPRDERPRDEQPRARPAREEVRPESRGTGTPAARPQPAREPAPARDERQQDSRGGGAAPARPEPRSEPRAEPRSRSERPFTPHGPADRVRLG